MKVFCYFVEPALYTIDLAINIYDKANIDYCFIKSHTLAKSRLKSNKICLDHLSIIGRFRYLLINYRRNDFIIVNGYNNYVFIFTFMCNLFSIKKKFIAIESDTQLSSPKNLLKRFVKWLYLSFIFRSKYILGFAGGSNSHKQLFKHYGMKEERVFLMPMMVDNSRFYHIKNMSIDKFTFLFVGRLVKHKNVENLIKQFNRNFCNQSAVLKIIGSGNQESYLRRTYSSDTVLFLGEIFDDDLVSEFKGASCFVCPSIFEPWGLVVNEALSSGLPVIATEKVGSTYDLVKDKNTGMIAVNMDDFGSKMLELYKNTGLLTQYSANASELMRNYWNYDLYNRCLHEALKKVEG